MSPVLLGILIGSHFVFKEFGNPGKNKYMFLEHSNNLEHVCRRKIASGIKYSSTYTYGRKAKKSLPNTTTANMVNILYIHVYSNYL
jgi:hypothetical protein